jgi:hypothetical protein
MNEPRVNCSPDKNPAWAQDRDDTSISTIHPIRSSHGIVTTMISRIFILGRVVHARDIRALHTLLYVQRPVRRVSMILQDQRSSENDSFDKVISQRSHGEIHLSVLEFFDNFRNYAYSTVSPAALNGDCSTRLHRLAEPKPTPHGYLEAFNLPRSVSAQALNVKITDRLSQLAKPRRNVILLQSAWKNKQK